MSSPILEEQSTDENPPTLWMLRFRVKIAAADPPKLDLLSVSNGVELPANESLQRILNDAMEKDGTPFWLMARNQDTERSIPPPLTVDICSHRYVLDYSGAVVQWFKEPTGSSGETFPGYGHWFCGREIGLSTLQETYFLNWLQRHCFPIASVFRTREFYQINIVLSVYEGSQDMKPYAHMSVWARSDTTLQELFEKVSGAKVDDSFGFRKLCWLGEPSEAGELGESPKSGAAGEVYTYSQSRRELTTLGELGWAPSSLVWLIPEKIEVEIARQE
ncbi:hypothetical protein Q9L58_007463 [Maublancomyces gigas]|uniref:Uncharacterized protein n=1 Tax=Discina gigas TaxID=1032678 RepID=A0ABR3GCE0_9PEZI